MKATGTISNLCKGSAFSIRMSAEAWRRIGSCQKQFLVPVLIHWTAWQVFSPSISSPSRLWLQQLIIYTTMLHQVWWHPHFANQPSFVFFHLFKQHGNAISTNSTSTHYIYSRRNLSLLSNFQNPSSKATQISFAAKVDDSFPAMVSLS